MKKLTLLILAALIAVTNFAQTGEEVALVTNGQGSTKREATENALRSAIEQAFGVFVSANTEILNDELIKDEIATVSSGNIQSYEEISSDQLADGTYEVTLKAVVSINKLVTYAQSHGSSCELSGQKFLMEQKMIELRQQNAAKAFEHLLLQLGRYIESNNIFECKIEVMTPRVKSNDMFSIPAIMTTSFSETAIVEMSTMIQKYMDGIGLSENEINILKARGMEKIMKVILHTPYWKYENAEKGAWDIYISPSPVAYWKKYGKKIILLNNLLYKKRVVVYDNNEKIYYLGECLNSAKLSSWGYANPQLSLDDPERYRIPDAYVNYIYGPEPGEGLYKCAGLHFNSMYEGREMTFYFGEKSEVPYMTIENEFLVTREQLSTITDLKFELYSNSPFQNMSYSEAITKCGMPYLTRQLQK